MGKVQYQGLAHVNVRKASVRKLLLAAVPVVVFLSVANITFILLNPIALLLSIPASALIAFILHLGIKAEIGQNGCE